MSLKKYQKIRTFTALVTLVGSVVGIGIFFKNQSIIKANDYSGWGTLLAWVMGGLISLSLIIPYSEIGSMKTKKFSGLPGWAKSVCGKKTGYFILFNYTSFYLGMVVVFISFFVAETLINVFTIAFDINQPNISVVILLGTCLLIFSLVANYVSLRWFGWAQRISTVLKFLPLIAVIFAGIILFDTNNLPSSSQSEEHFGFNLLGSAGSSLKLSNVAASLPMVLFAFDSFLVVGSITKKIDKSEKRMPIIMITGIVIVLIVYLLLTIALLLHGVGMVSGEPFGISHQNWGLFGQVLPSDWSRIVGIIVMLFIAISAYGVQNAVTMGFVNSLGELISNSIFFKSNKALKRFGLSKSLIIYATLIIGYWSLMLFIPALIRNSDAPIDAFSNFPTLYFFGIYSLVILGYTKKRKSLSTKKLGGWFFWPAVVLGTAGVSLVVGWQIFYEYSVHAFLEPNLPSPAGIFIGSSDTRILDFSFFVLASISFWGFPFINKLLIAKEVQIDRFFYRMIAIFRKKSKAIKRN